MSDLVIYDTEATDADIRHGQITQFAGLKTDLDFNISEEINFRVKRLPWVVPSPVALTVTKMQAKDLDIEDGLSEYEAARKMEKFLVPGYGQERTLVTFRGPSFDDELIRTTLFRNLNNPWFSSGKLTSRLDVFHLVRLAKTINQNALKVPMGDEGKLTWRLEKLCEANGIPLDAHDALADSYGTLEIADLVRKSTPNAWKTLLRCGSPVRQEELLITAHKTGKPLLLFQFFSEAKVIPCAVLGTNKQKGWILLDLRAENIPDSADEIKGTLFTKDTSFPIVKSNMAPIFLDETTAKSIDPSLDTKLIIAKANEIKGSQLAENAVEAYRSQTHAPISNMTSEEKIYSGFISDKDKPNITSFHRAETWEKKLAINFYDERLQDFKARILLDAYYAKKASFHESDVAMLREQCSEALNRPFAEADSRFMTIKKAVEVGIPRDWADWAEDVFDYKIDPSLVSEDQTDQLQMSF
jgi:exodeoxyribonuclease-1